jgi:hypothetical protein
MHLSFDAVPHAERPALAAQGYADHPAPGDLPKRHRPASSAPSGPTTGVFILCCAAAQLDFPAQQLQGVTEVLVPFEEAIVIGWRTGEGQMTWAVACV